MSETKKHIISKSAKRKMSSVVEFTCIDDMGKAVTKKKNRIKAMTYTQMVVYKTPIGKRRDGKILYRSQTKHEIAPNK